MLAEYGLLDLIGTSAPPADLLGACLDLFDGHPVPALLLRNTWTPAPRTSRRTAFAAHLLGLTMAGSYPFRGVPVGGCDCPEKAHVCLGLGCDYLVIDLDDKRGEGGMETLTAMTVGACLDAGLRPLAFTSRSGRGVHVYVFFDDLVPTPMAHAAGQEIVRRAGAVGRADVLPSAGHATGFGTLHALPLFPPSAGDENGGLLLDHRRRYVTDHETIVAALREAHLVRSSALSVRALYAALPSVLDGAPQRPGVRRNPTSNRALPPHVRPGVSRPVPTGTSPMAAPTKDDWRILAAMRRSHPQFRAALGAAEAGAWKGGRSARDAHLAAMMLRQGMRPLAAAKALTRLPGTKAAERGLDYAVATVMAVPRARGPEAPRAYAGTKRRGVRRATPWRDRVPPPLDYDGERNPWWEPTVQQRLTGRTKFRDGVVLAYLIDRWHRGEHPRRQFYAGVRIIGADLGIPASSVQAVITRLRERFPDVVRIVPGVPHPHLRLATAFDVVSARTHDRVLWHLGAGQTYPDPVSFGKVEREEATQNDAGDRRALVRESASGRDSCARPSDATHGGEEAAHRGADSLPPGIQRRRRPRHVCSGA